LNKRTARLYKPETYRLFKVGYRIAFLAYSLQQGKLEHIPRNLLTYITFEIILGDVIKPYVMEY
jgi:hypothetical protein